MAGHAAASTDALLGPLLPDGTATVEEFGEATDTTLMPGEETAVARAVPARRREFASTRRCARQALAQLGVAQVAITTGPRREPRWPSPVVGSITHCPGYRAAAVALRETAGGIGIDAEPHEPLPAGVIEAVTGAAERADLARLTTADPAIRWDRILFSAKESVYKAWYPLTGRWLGFDEAVVTLDATAQTFAARLLVPGDRVDGRAPLTGFTGRWRVDRGLIVTSVALPPDAAVVPSPRDKIDE